MSPDTHLNTTPEFNSKDAVLAELVGRARDLVPVLRERAQKTEELRQIPEETMRDLEEAGLLRCLRPERVGGYELDYGCQAFIAAELGRGCGSTAWVNTLIACHDHLLGMYEPEAQEDVWKNAPVHTKLATSWGIQKVECEEVDGGYRVSGHWRFSTGIDHCDWAQLFAPVPQEGTHPEPRIMLIPKSDYTIKHEWFAHGLSGTGSHDVHVENAFVPKHRSLDMSLLNGGPTPGSAVNPGHLYKLPLWFCFSLNLSCASVGIARGLMENFIEQTGDKHSMIFDVKVAELRTLQLRIAESAAEVDCAELLYKRQYDEINELGRSGKELTPEFRVRYRRDTSYAALLCMRACDRIQAVTGAHMIDKHNPVQRAWRDVRALNAQVAVMFDANAWHFGSVALGQGTGDPRI